MGNSSSKTPVLDLNVPPGYQLFYSELGPVLVPIQQYTYAFQWGVNPNVPMENFPSDCTVEYGTPTSAKHVAFEEESDVDISYVNSPDLSEDEEPAVPGNNPSQMFPSAPSRIFTPPLSRAASSKIVALNASLKTIRHKFGLGISMYFNFIKFTHRYCLLFFLAGLFVYIPSLLQLGTDDFPDLNFRDLITEIKEHTTSYDGLFTLPLIFSAARYYPQIRYLFYISVALNVFIALALPFRYLLHHEKTLKKFEKEDSNVAALTRTKSLKNTKFDIIPENAGIHWFIRFLRQFIGFIAWLATLVLASSFTYISVQFLADAPQGHVLISVFFTVSNYFWKRVAKRLIEFERHKTYTSKYAARLFHVYVLKLSAVIVMYLTRFLVWSRRRLDISYREAGCLCFERSIGSTNCGFDTLASQIFWIITIDMFVVNLFKWLWPLFKKEGSRKEGKERV
ncbi:hypothetical protein GEMRC1_001492 [Eukaryota sp. GEM-RC1]